MPAQKKSQSTFRLLPYQILAKRWLGPAFWLIPIGAFLWWGTYNLPDVEHRYASAGLMIAGVGALIVIYTLLARRAHVTFHKNSFVIHTPFYPIAFSYRRIEMVRLTEFKNVFSPEKEKNIRRRLYQDLWGKTVNVVNVKDYPLPLWWMRLWLHPYLIHPQEKALVLVVEDWMGLSRKLEALRQAWQDARLRRQG